MTRDEFAEIVGCRGHEVIFTSGGTEADNLAILGASAMGRGGVVASAAEHKAVLVPAMSKGANVIPVDRHCIVDLDALSGLIDGRTAVVSVMAVNNEVGTIQPIAEVAAVVREHSPALLHCDAVQAFAFCDAVAMTALCDLVTYSAHKFGGPKGIGGSLCATRRRIVFRRSISVVRRNKSCVREPRTLPGRLA